jgi:hypothetical protein
MRGCRHVVSPGSSAVSEVSGVVVDWYGGACVLGEELSRRGGGRGI